MPPDKEVSVLIDAIQVLNIRQAEIAARLASMKESQDAHYHDAKEERKLLFAKIDEMYRNGCAFASTHIDQETRVRIVESRLDKIHGTVGAIAVIIPLAIGSLWQWIVSMVRGNA